MKNGILFMVILLGGIVAQAGNVTGSANVLKAHTWKTFFSFEPVQPLRESIEVKFNDDTSANVTVTCHYSEFAGQGSDVVLVVPVQVALVDGSFQSLTDSTTSKSNDQGKPCSFKIDKETFPFVIMWGGRQAAMFQRVFDAEN